MVFLALVGVSASSSSSTSVFLRLPPLVVLEAGSLVPLGLGVAVAVAAAPLAAVAPQSLRSLSDSFLSL